MAANGSDDDHTRSFTTLAAGTEVSHYTIVSRIGAGGMGEVYLARDSRLDRKVALKFLPLHLCNDEASRTRFTREAKAAAKLDHPNIVPVYEVGEFQSRPFFAMAHIEGSSLREVIKLGKLSVADAIRYTTQICEGLHKAHDVGVVHRDVKPANIIIDPANRARLVDFGLATVAGEEKLTRTGSTVGTVGYMSPEQVSGGNVDHRSDLFSVGVMLYEMITGHRPFQGDNDAAIIKAISDSAPEPIARFKSGTSAELQQIIDKALAKDPAVRYQHADGMLADLKRLETEKPVSKKGSARWIIAAVAVLAVAGGYLTYSKLTTRKPTGGQKVKRLVVLPFDNSGEKDEAYFASGVTDEVVQKLSSIRGLSVVSGISAARLKEAGVNLKAIGDSLGVQYVLDASTRYQLGSDGTRRVRVVTQLINVTEDRVVWSETYDTVMTEVFSVQSQIAERVSKEMGVVLLPRDKKEIWERWSTTQEAYDLYLRGWRAATRFGGYGEKPLRTGARLMERAIALDSGFVLPYCQLADIYGRLYFFSFERTDSIKALSLWCAQQADSLSEGAWISNFPMGRYYYLCEKDYQKALDFYDKAYKGNKKNADYLNYAHHCLRRMGRWEEAYDYMSRVVELQPRVEWHIFDLATDCVYMRRYPEAESLFTEVIALKPEYWEAYELLFQLYCFWQGDLDKARDLVAQSEGFIDESRWTGLLAWIDMAESDYSEKPKGLTVPPYDSMSYHLALGMYYRSARKQDSARIHCQYWIERYDSLLQRRKGNPNFFRNAALAVAIVGNRARAIALMDTSISLLSVETDALEGANLKMGYVELYNMLGDEKTAIAYLDSLLSIPSTVGLGWFMVDPDFKDMVNQPDFIKIMNKHADSIQWALYNEKVKKL